MFRLAAAPPEFKIKWSVPMQKQTTPRLLYPYCVLIAAALLFVCTKSSPLYPLNDWVDTNIYFTIGKGLMRGYVPYLDLYDQKGPVVYLLYGLGSLISSRSFFGVYVLEALSFGAFLYLSHRIISLYSGRNALVALPVLGTLILSSMSFSHGGSLEEFCLPVFAYGLYSMLRYDRMDAPAPLKMVFANGLLAGLLLFSKFTLLAFYAAWMAVLLFWQCLRHSVSHGLVCCAVFGCAMLLTGVPWMIYFAVNDALPEFWHYYFYTNVFGYSTLEAPVLLNMLLAIVKGTLATLLRNFQYALLIAGGLLYFTFAKAGKLTRMGKIAVWGMFLLLPCGLYMGGQNYRYYGLTLAAFAPLGCVPLVELWNACVAPKLVGRRWPRALPACLSVLGVGISLLVSGNVYLLGVPKENTPQGQFAAAMEQSRSGDAITLLCRAFPDSGFYLAADVIPSNRFFSSNNVMLPENAAEQVRLVEAGAPEFVIMRNREDAPGPRYVLIDTADLPYEDDLWTYRLYQRDGSGS